ncbi:MAG: nitroreductase family protein [Candidatus Limnocylindria bacterium]
MEVWTAIVTQRAVRTFADRAIPDEALERILDAGRRAPSSKNSQPWDFVIVTDRGRLQRLAEVGRYAGHLAGATLAVALVTPDQDDPREVAADLYDVGHASQSMMLVALELGIGSVHAAVYDKRLAKRLLGLPADRRCDYLISFGYPARAGQLDKPRRKTPRRALHEIVHHESW